MTKSQVAVIIPAFNAERTIDATIRSVRCQTHQDLDVVVVDDGSTDQTPEIVREHTSCDSRIRLIRQPNSGVAAARNLAIAETSAPYIAPIDADDLWRPTKIERQLAQFACEDDSLGLVYTRCAIIDGGHAIVAIVPEAPSDASALELCRRNFIGCGSSPMMRRDAVTKAGGYDVTLRARNAEGCEDFKIYFEIATQFRLGLVAEILTGYREGQAAMSSDVLRMLNSRELCAADIETRFPEFRNALVEGRLNILRFNLARAIRNGNVEAILGMVVRLAQNNPVNVARSFAALMQKKNNVRLTPPADRVGQPFMSSLESECKLATQFISAK